MAAPVVLDRVARVYGSRRVLAGISGEFEGVNLITGENGAGKSTLLRITARLARPTAGKVITDGTVGYLGHAPFIYPDLNARENLLFWARAARIDAAEVDARLAAMNLLKAAAVRARHFSRGMLQRLGLARVFLGDPRILLLDEPGAGLDAPSREIMRGEIAAAARRGACVFMVSHDEGDKSIADRVFVLARGRLEEA